MWYRFKPYVSVAKRRANAAREVSKLQKNGQKIEPVVIEGRKIATTFWGQSWCKNLEAYSDFSNRLPRGRTYVCNGSVVDLQIEPGKITALVSGSSLYRIAIDIDKLPTAAWTTIRRECAGQIGSIVELLQGRLSKHVMEIVTQPNDGLFPKPKEIRMKCSCPDWAGLCKHLAAVLYGVGARLDRRPELLFHLRQVDHIELIEQAVEADSGRTSAKANKTTIAAGDLADVFGIDIDSDGKDGTSGVAAASKKPRGSSKAGKSAKAAKAASALPASGADVDIGPESAPKTRTPRRSPRRDPEQPAAGELSSETALSTAPPRKKRAARAVASGEGTAVRPAGKRLTERAAASAVTAARRGKMQATARGPQPAGKTKRDSRRPK